MNSNHPALISGGLFFVIGLALAAALFTGLLPHCWHNGPSVCYWMTRAAGGASAVVAFLGLAMMFSRSAGAGFGMAVGVFLNAILIAGVAGPLIGPCPSPMMHCHSITQPVLIVAAAVIAVIALIEIRRLASRCSGYSPKINRMLPSRNWPALPAKHRRKDLESMTNPQPSQNVAGQPAKAAGEYKPLTTFTIAAANVTQRPLRSILLGLIAAVFTFLLFSSAMVTANLEAGISSLAARMGADVLVVPQGQGKKIQSVILRAEPSTFYLDGKLLDVVQKLPGVAKASGQLFISSLDAQCCSVKVQLIGIDEATDFVIAPWLKHAADKPLSGNDVIVGDYIYGEIGSTLKFFDQEYRIVGRLAPTGMGFDSSIFMTLDAARRAGRAASPDRADEMAQSLSAILVRVNPGVDPITVSDELLDQLGLKANVNFVFASNMMSDTSAKLQKVVSVMYTAAGGFWAAAAVIMLIVYFFAFSERQREFATLRALGASRGKVVGIVLAEAFIISMLGSAVGIGLAALVVSNFSTVIAHAIGLPYLAPETGSWLRALAASVAAGILTVPLASLPTAWRIGRSDIFTTLRED